MSFGSEKTAVFVEHSHMAFPLLCLQTVISAAHAVTAMTDSCQFMMQCQLRPKRKANTDFQPCPLSTDTSPDSSFDDIMYRK